VLAYALMRGIAKRKKGFSLLEVILSVFILSIGLVAVIQLYAKNYTESASNRDRIIAAELAQEGIELVRNIRDDNVAANNSNVFSGMSIGTNQRIDITSTALGSGDKTLYFHSGALGGTVGTYTHKSSGGTATRFKRKIDIAQPTSDQIQVSSMVIWDGASTFPSSSNCTFATSCTLTSAVLTNWQ